MREPGGVEAQRPATRGRPPRWLWIANLLVGLVSVPLAVLGFWQFSRSDELHHLGFGAAFTLMAIVFLINAVVGRRRGRGEAPAPRT